MANENGSALKRFWRSLNKPSKYSFLGIATLFFFVGIIVWGGFNTILAATNTLGFCVTCHEMRENYREYKTSIHYKNRAGVRAICSDCHVPKDWPHMFLHKIAASYQVWGHITGIIDTPKKFEAHRMQLAEKVWARMKANNSRECRNCHSFEAMSADDQPQTEYRKHMKAKADGQTCIDCHKGIAHHLPKEYHVPGED